MSLTRDASGLLRLGGIDLADLAMRAGTPAYVYDLDAIAAEARALQLAFDDASHLVAYAVKANTAGPVLRAVAGQGCGADVVSGAELLVATSCGVAPEEVVFSGVAKTDEEIDRAIACGARGIAALQLESVEEITRVRARASAAGRRARVSIRVNPSVNLEGVTHASIATGHDAAKFGVALDDVGRAVELIGAAGNLDLVGMAAHAGSQFTSVSPYVEACRVLFGVTRALRSDGRAASLAFVDSGGGFGIDYTAAPTVRRFGTATAPSVLPQPADFVRAARREQRLVGLDDLALYVEPGRSLVGTHGILLARVIQVKVASGARWLMIDAGMNDLIRPALYQARHRVVPVDREVDEATALPWRVVGPVCESSDDFGQHSFPANPPPFVAILDAGAYGYTMASSYNGRQLPIEIFVASGRVVAQTSRRSIESWAAERASYLSAF
ncbi:MAG: diaminopimelate decarboxylase [Polyangiaceae bacterium]|jgi:diaminopimelate decarboxylase